MLVGMVILMISMLIVASAAVDITFNVNSRNAYSSLVDQLRNAVKDPTLKYHDLPTVKLLKEREEKFININFRVAEAPAISMTIQVKKLDLYVIGYKDKFSGKDRAFYIPPKPMDPTYKESEVFPDVTQREAMKFQMDHTSMSQAANIPNLQFTLHTLENFMRGVYGKATTIKDFKKFQARFFLVAVLMTSESARFEYVKQKTVQQQKIEPKVTALVRDWGTISSAISCNPGGRFPTTIVLDSNPKTKWEINTVADIKPYMGLLKYVDLEKECK